MNRFYDIRENALLEQLAGGFTRSALQQNRLHEADAELVRLPGSDQWLALTADALVEEIALGLYDDPALVGWMTVTASASDLAAVGADPLGVLLVESLPGDLEAAAVRRLQEHIEAACRTYALPVLGGDTNRSPSWQMTAVAVGRVPAGQALTRRGARPGEVVCATGPLGAGTAFAAARLQGVDPGFSFRPEARLVAGALLRDYASCCIDTSDGALAALDQLMRLGDVGFRLDPVERRLHPAAQQAAAALGVPPWMMLAGLHGEFELLFTLPEQRLPALTEAAAAQGWQPLRLGVVTAAPAIRVACAPRPVVLDTGRIRNRFADSLSPLDELIRDLHACSQPSC